MEKTEKYPNLSWQFTRWGGFAGQTDSAYKDLSTKPEKAADFIRAIREGDILFPTDGITPSISQKLEDMGFTREEQQSHKNRSWTKEEFEAALRGMEKYYHIHHPYHTLMNEGKLTKAQLQGWVANRFYYQTSIPIKDANILANCPDRETRAKWTQRILDHDGHEGDVGGIEAWLQLGIAVGLTREELLSQQHVLPAVRFAVDAYVNFARRAEWHEAASSSLTELFAPKIHQQRLDNWPEHYPWVEQEGYIYFKKRLTEARRDVEHGLAITLDWYKTREQQDRMVQILKFKLDVLWVMADAMYLAYINEMPPYFNIA